ncbi:MAG: hypothetical protein ACI4S1_06160 [Roseburia sp.]
MGKIFKRILLLPVYLLLVIAGSIYDFGLRVYSVGAGIFYLYLFIFLALAVICQKWRNVLILTLIIGVAMFITVVLGIIGAFIEIGKERVKLAMTK